MSHEQDQIPKTQTVALVRELGGPVEFKSDYPVPTPKENEVLVKVLYTGVCQSDLHTKNGTASDPTGLPITAIKLPHIGGHEGIGRIIRLGPSITPNSHPHITLNRLVGIQFLARICHTCGYCLAGQEQFCEKLINHLHHEDGSFQEYCVLDASYLALLPDDVDASVMGPVLCAGLTAYNAVRKADVKRGEYVVVVGAAGGLGHFAVQFARAAGASVIAIDSGSKKKTFLESLGVDAFVDFATSADVVREVRSLTGDNNGAHAVVVTSGNAKAYVSAADMLRPGGVLSCVGIPLGKAFLEIPVAGIVIKGLRIVGSLVGSMEETMEAVEMVRRGVVRPVVSVRRFEDLPAVYEELERGDVSGRIVLKIADD